jgi:hypothetical protein
MKKIAISDDVLCKGAKLVEGDADDAVLLIPAAGGGLSLPELIGCPERYLVFYAEDLEDHSMPVQLIIRLKGEEKTLKGNDIIFGLMPRFRALICIDLKWLDGHVLFPGSTPGQLKVVRHGGRVTAEEIAEITLEASPSYHEVKLCLSGLRLTDERPGEYPIPDVKLIDEFGQYKGKEWPGKTKGLGELKARLEKALELPDSFGAADWDRWGGWSKKKLTEGTGYFGKVKAEGRWWLVDPEGHAFFSAGPCGTIARSDCRVDDLEKLMDWLPSPDDPVYGKMYEERTKRYRHAEVRSGGMLFSFEQANLYKVFGDAWYEKWKTLMVKQLKTNGLNTLANWSDRKLFSSRELPYVFMLDRFPATAKFIFRDFPDVLSEEYAEDAKLCAQYLTPLAQDPYMIGYFLRNEPSWAFVDNLVLADEVLYNPEPSVCKDKLIEFLKERYGNVGALAQAWGHRFDSFDDLRKPLFKPSSFSAAAKEDLREFSRVLIRAYVSLPSKACREVDAHHMNLGMRWAWISDPDLVSGWENFDVFSINCYFVDPTPALDNVVRLGVELPVMIGEFHFGALDLGQSSTGLQGTINQGERGKAYRYYCERVASHSHGVGCHWFQCYDQFELGRFDGENYNIGLFDLCSLPNEEMMKAVRGSGEAVYGVMEGSIPPFSEKPKIIPRIAF